MSEYNEAYCREQLAEADAVSFEQAANGTIAATPLLGDSEFTRCWDELELEDTPGLLDFLEDYTSVNNLHPSKTVTDPSVNGEPVIGLWRNAVTRRIVKGEVATIVQTLRKGYITRLVTNGALSFDEARLENTRRLRPGTLDTSAWPSPETGGNTSEDYVLVKWPNCSPYNLAQIEESISALAPSGYDVTIRGESYGTGYHSIYVTSRIEDDGSGTILALFAKPEFALLAFETLWTSQNRDVKYIWGIPKELAQGVLTAERGVGKTARCDYSKQGGLVDITIYSRDFDFYDQYTDVSMRLCDYDETTTYYWGVSDPHAVDVPAIAYAGQMYRKSLRSNMDGTFDIAIEFRMRNYRWYDWRFITTSTLQEVSEYQQFGVIDDNVIPDIEDLDEQGKIYKQNVQILEDCSKNVTTQCIESNEDSFYISWLTKNGVAFRWQYTNMHDIPTGTIGSLSESRLNDLSFRTNMDGTYDGEIISHPTTVTWEYNSNFYWNQYEPGIRHVKNATGGGGSDCWYVLWNRHWVRFFASEEDAHDYGSITFSPRFDRAGPFWRVDGIVWSQYAFSNAAKAFNQFRPDMIGT